MDRYQKLNVLCEAISFSSQTGQIPDTPISRITADSREVIPGALFVACPGASFDGHDFIEQAVAAGASAIVGEKEIEGLSVPYIKTDNSREKLAYLAAAFYGNPSSNLIMIGVTGTDGKTTTSNILHNILEVAGFKAGLISTVNAVFGDQELDTGFHVTTPDSPQVQYYLSLMLEAGITHVVLETTSHGWEQYRVDACDFDIGIVTNVTHEHLDQHGSYHNYLAAKGRLFESLAASDDKGLGVKKLAILNKDDSSYKYLIGVTKVETSTYGFDPGAEYVISEIAMDGMELNFNIRHPNNDCTEIKTRMVGLYNSLNCAAAFAVAVEGLRIDPSVAAKGIYSTSSIPGRMERIDCGQDFSAFVDFAHTPNALKNTLQTARQLTNRNVITIFGSAGLRDKEKRRMMAEISTSFADLSIFTAEDPRTESLNAILDEMADGAKNNGAARGIDFWCEPDRREAIRKGVKLAKPGDILIVCGKGHEQSMCFGTTEYPWDDRTALRAALSEITGIPGPDMPFLPEILE
ncbi:UDP-N-acetylmuramoyl-L-alanyl-D-glutamate--2,6-diaminopimelate ligase [Chloroflexota bacterium]